MTDLLQALRQREQQIMQQGAPSAGPSRAGIAREAQLADMLMQGGRATTNPLVAALSGFVGARKVKSLADLEDQAARAEEQKKRRREARTMALQEIEIERQQNLDKERSEQFEREFGLKASALAMRRKESNARLAKISSEIEAIKERAQRGGLELKDALQVEDKLRDDYIKESKDFKAQRDAYTRINVSGKNPSAAGDLALIFNYMKLLDPGSTVREGEFANAQNAGGVGAKITAAYNNVLRGERLSEEQRADFLNRSGMLYNAAQSQHQQTAETFVSLAQSAGVRPENVAIPLGAVDQNAEQVREQSIDFSGLSNEELEALANAD